MPEATGHDPGGDPLDHVRDAIGRWIRHHREFLGLSQESLRRRLHDRGVRVSQSTLSRWERGDALPPTNVLPDLARTLGATLQGYEELVARARARRIVDVTGRSFEDLLAEGLEAAKAGLLQRAADHLEAALDLATLEAHSPPVPTRARALLQLAWVLLRLWHLDRARACLRDLAGLPDLPAVPTFLGLVMRLELAHRYGDHDAAAAFARVIRDDLPDDPAPRARGLAALAAWHFAGERAGEVVPPAEEALRLWRDLGDDRERARSLGVLSWARARLGEPEHAAASLAEATTLARRTGAREVEAFLLRVRGRVRAEAGDVPGALALLEDAAALARRLDLPEDEFIAAWHAWRIAPGDERERLARRLRRRLSAVSSFLPEARAFAAETAHVDNDEEDPR